MMQLFKKLHNFIHSCRKLDQYFHYHNIEQASDNIQLIP